MSPEHGSVRLVVLIDRYLPVLGGAQIAVHGFCSRLSRRGFAVTVLTRVVDDSLAAEEIIDGVRILRFGRAKNRVRSKLLCTAQISRFLRKRRSDIDVVMSVPCVYLTDFLPLAVLGKGIPYIVRSTMMQNFDLLLRWRTSNLDEALKKVLIPPPLARRILRGARANVVQSSVLARSAERLGIKSLRVIPTGADRARFSPKSASEKAELRRLLQLDSQDFVIVNVGRYVKDKNQITLLKAVTHLVSRRGDKGLKLLILGATEKGQVTENKTHLVEYVEAYELSSVVCFVDDAKNVEDYLGASDIFAFPSSFDEGMPNALVEAMSCGLPIISSDLPQMVSALPAGYAHLCAPGDADAWAHEIASLMDSPEECADAGQQVLSHARQNFDIEVITDRYEELISGRASHGEPRGSN